MSSTTAEIKLEDAPTENWGTRIVRSALSEGGSSWALPFAPTLSLHRDMRLVHTAYGELIMDWDARPSLDSMDGIIQGGVLTVLADLSQGHCFSTTLDEPCGFSTVDFQTRFLRPVPSGDIYRIESRLLQRARRTGLIETWIFRPDGKPTTHVVGSWQIVERDFRVKPASLDAA